MGIQEGAEGVRERPRRSHHRPPPAQRPPLPLPKAAPRPPSLRRRAAPPPHWPPPLLTLPPPPPSPPLKPPKPQRRRAWNSAGSFSFLRPIASASVTPVACRKEVRAPRGFWGVRRGEEGGRGGGQKRSRRASRPPGSMPPLASPSQPPPPPQPPPTRQAAAPVAMHSRLPADMGSITAFSLSLPSLFLSKHCATPCCFYWKGGGGGLEKRKGFREDRGDQESAGGAAMGAEALSRKKSTAAAAGEARDMRLPRAPMQKQRSDHWLMSARAIKNQRWRRGGAPAAAGATCAQNGEVQAGKQASERGASHPGRRV